MNEAEKILVEALRSGEYKQGAYRLELVGQSHCCLGVACREFVKRHPGVLREDQILETVKGNERTVVQYEKQYDCGLPPVVANWLGWGNSVGMIKSVFRGRVKELTGRDYVTDLVELNDSGVSFDTIATLIEEGAMYNG